MARSLYVTDFGGRVYPATELDRLASPATLVPSWVPAGYRLDSVFGAPGQELALVYRRGLLQLIVDSFGRDYLLKHRALAFDRTDWPTLESDQLVQMGRGPLAGWPAAVNNEPGARGRAVGRVFRRGRRPCAVATCSASPSRCTRPPALTRRRRSTRRQRPSCWSPAPRSPLSWPYSGSPVCGARLSRRPSIKGVGWLPLIGAAVVVLGAGLHWHAMLG